jgi:integrase
LAVRELHADEDAASTDDTVNPDSILSPEEIRIMLEATDTRSLSCLVYDRSPHGRPSGELFALRWTDVEMPDGLPAHVYIRRTVSWARVKGEDIRPRYYPPKTKAGHRSIPIAPDLVSILKA